MVSLGFQVTRFGTVEQLKTLTDNTVSPDERERKLLLASLRRSVSALSFSPQRAASRVTLPVVFDA
jgi:hypothetical protein